MPDQILISELFGPVLQGEGAMCGRVSHFVRTSGCPLRCNWCFGVMPGRRMPHIVTATGPNKPLPEVKVGDRLLTFDTEGRFVETTVIDTGNREVDVWLRITIEGRQYFVTEEHPFFTNRGLVRADALVVGDMVLHAKPQDKLSWSKRGDANPMKRPEVAKKVSDSADRQAISQRVIKLRRQQKQQGIPIGFAAWDDEAKARLAELTSARMTGDGNPNWQGGRQVNFNREKRAIAGKLLPCERCRRRKKLEIHHKDGDPANDSTDNLERICHQCHSIEHRRGFNFWAGTRRDGKVSHAPDVRNGKQVQAIKRFDRDTFFPSTRPKPLRVYNLTCAPYNTYLIDYMWVHNCDSMHAVDPQQIKVLSHKMTPEQVIEAVYALPKAPWVTLTGGDPVAWDLTPIVCMLKYDFKLAVETQGTNWDDWLEYADLVTCSPKGPSSGMSDQLDIAMLRKYEVRLGGRLVFKIVAFGDIDLDFAERIHRKFPDIPLYITAGTPVDHSVALVSIRLKILDSFRLISEAVLQRPGLRDATVGCQQHALLYGRELAR